MTLFKSHFCTPLIMTYSIAVGTCILKISMPGKIVHKFPEKKFLENMETLEYKKRAIQLRILGEKSNGAVIH